MVHDKTGQYHLLVEREQVSFSGDECNKIGTSYSAFNNQPGDACGQPLGTCLKNQILDVYEADMERISQGKTPRNILKKYGNAYNLKSTSGDKNSLSFPVNEV